MNSLLEKAINVMGQVNPEAPAVEVAEAAVATAANPAPDQIIADVELAISLFRQFKAQLSGMHPTVLSVIKLLI
jgi:hypothetical protein